ncbi:hypothetical protein [Kitasatospora mediocidica]|uniref:hypothetical protein n=1 Tax=Kitasatospora mediocidica TaxID=58352 RepID=UPI000561B6EC|nr:hypothetical protein [Kitasatospora mediocidica]
MWGSKSRRIAELEARETYLRKALDAARGTTVQPVKVELDWEKLAKQLARDRVIAARADAREMARLRDVAEGWIKLASLDRRRADLLSRAMVRSRETIRQLRAEVSERDIRPALQQAS